MEEVSGYYHFLVGVLNSEYEGNRSFVPLYGFTEILPGRITTDRIVSSDGDSYFDMAANSMRLGDKLKYINGILYLDFLFSKGANIGNWIFDGVSLKSQNGKASLNGVTGDVDIKGKFLGQINATSGSFKGAENMFEFLLDADNRVFSIKGPKFVEKDSFIPKQGTSQFEYLTFGNFIDVGYSNTIGGFITPQIIMRRPNQDGTVSTVTIDAFNGLLFDNGHGRKNFFSWGVLNLDVDSIYTSRERTPKGMLYRDGEYLKIKTD